MSAGQYTIHVNGIAVQVVRKAIKSLYLRVSPPDGRVRVSAPRRASDRAVRHLVVSKLHWIHRQRARLHAMPPPVEPELITGETHAVFGRPYRLQVTEGARSNSVRTQDDSILELSLRKGTSQAGRRRILEQWYRSQLKQRLPGLVFAWEPVIGVEVADWRVKRMRSRWGSCNITERRIWLNLELARLPLPCLDYVVLHEMTHLLERYHNPRFYRLLDGFMPDWREYREELNQTAITGQ